MIPTIQDLCRACQNNEVAKAKELLEAGIDPSEGGQDAISHAALSGSLAVLKLLLKDPRVNVNTTGGFPLWAAVSTGNLEACKILLKAGANPSLDDFCALQIGGGNTLGGETEQNKAKEWVIRQMPPIHVQELAASKNDNLRALGQRELWRRKREHFKRATEGYEPVEP